MDGRKENRRGRNRWKMTFREQKIKKGTKEMDRRLEEEAEM